MLAVAQTTLGVGVAIERTYAATALPVHRGAVRPSSVPGPNAVAPTSGSGPPPLAMAIPTVGISSSLVRLHVGGDGALGAPGSFGVAGWWAEGPEPGSPGAAVLVGHVDSYTGPGIFYRLEDVKPGAEVQVSRSDGSVLAFTVDGTRQFAKDQFPVQEIYGPTATPSLRLITCGGHFDRQRGEYDDNVVVFAHLLPPGDANRSAAA